MDLTGAYFLHNSGQQEVLPQAGQQMAQLICEKLRMPLVPQMEGADHHSRKEMKVLGRPSADLRTKSRVCLAEPTQSNWGEPQQRAWSPLGSPLLFLLAALI